MNQTIQPVQPDDELIEMPGSTFSKTWRVTLVSEHQIHVKLVDQAVGYKYAYEDVNKRWDRGEVNERLESGNLTKA